MISPALKSAVVPRFRNAILLRIYCFLYRVVKKVTHSYEGRHVNGFFFFFALWPGYEEHWVVGKGRGAHPPRQSCSGAASLLRKLQNSCSKTNRPSSDCTLLEELQANIPCKPPTAKHWQKRRSRTRLIARLLCSKHRAVATSRS